MPQLDVSTFSPQLFWVALSFVTLYFLLSKLLLPRIASVLHARQQSLDTYLSKASLYREEAENLLVDYEAELALARKEAQASTRIALQALTEKASLKKQRYLDKMATTQHAEEQKLYRAYVHAKGKLPSLIEELSPLVLEKLLSSPPPKKGHSS